MLRECLRVAWKGVIAALRRARRFLASLQGKRKGDPPIDRLPFAPTARRRKWRITGAAELRVGVASAQDGMAQGFRRFRGPTRPPAQNSIVEDQTYIRGWASNVALFGPAQPFT